MAGSTHARSWTLLQMIQWSAEYLTQKGFANGRLLSERLLAHLLGLRRVDIYLQFDRPLDPEELADYKRLFLRLVAHEPLQYILGETEFMSLTFQVGPGVLIPRPETELLVEKTLEHAKAMLPEREEIRILDIGTGSGCIAIALAHALPRARVTALDISREALGWAAKNCENHGIGPQVNLLEHDFNLPPLPEWAFYFDLAVANPPYVRQADWQTLDPEIRDHEPRLALVGGEDGLDAYRSLAQALPGLLRCDGQAFLEVGDGMAAAVGELFKKTGFERMDFFPDLAGKERLVHLYSSGGYHE